MQRKNYEEILTEVTIDYMNFHLTWNPYEENSCILWFRDIRTSLSFTALGKFSSFDKLKILSFIVRFSLDENLRKKIEMKKFEHRINSLDLTYFDHVELSCYADKERAYRNLFCLDSEIDKNELRRRRRLMARKFHPDAGGNHKAMTIINEAYEYLNSLCKE